MLPSHLICPGDQSPVVWHVSKEAEGWAWAGWWGGGGGGYQVRLFLASDTLDVVLADRRWKLQSFQFRVIKPPFTAVSCH